jgi:hypothetical protein
MYQSPLCPLLPIKWMLCEKALFLSTTCVCILCVCVFYFFHTHQRPKPKTFFFFWGWVGWDRWWVYWFLIVYSLLLPWQFPHYFIFFSQTLKFSIFYFFFLQVTKKFWKKILNIQENYIWLKWFFKLFIYLTNIFEACYQGMFFFL